MENGLHDVTATSSAGDSQIKRDPPSRKSTSITVLEVYRADQIIVL